MIKILGIIVIIFSFLLNIYFLVDRYKDSFRNYYTVTKVIDGDSFEVDEGANVRLLGIDAPEIELCGAKEAKELLEKLILNKKVKISPAASDTFRRLVADVYVDGKSINNQMVASGWARYDSSDSADSKIMRENGEIARKTKLGVFGEKCSQIVPPNNKCKIKANVNDTFGNKNYYPPDCGIRYDNITVDLFRGDQWFCSEKEAIDVGFVKAKVCQ